MRSTASMGRLRRVNFASRVMDSYGSYVQVEDKG